MIWSNLPISSGARLANGGLWTIITSFEDLENSKTSSKEEISWLGYSGKWKSYLSKKENVKGSGVLEHS